MATRIVYTGTSGDIVSIAIHGDTGAPFNLTGITNPSLALTSPQGVETTYAATFLAPNLIQIVTTPSTFPIGQPGIWKAQAIFTLPGRPVAKSNVVTFTVEDSLA